MTNFLICENPTCRFIVNLRDGAHVLERSNLVLDDCPECGHPWSSHCPFCGHPLEVIWRDKLPQCLKCGKQLQPVADAPPAP
jgi:predicted RNA-binding Zn-ribbon protein involved in translation (DUF1610 family)